MAVIYEKPAEIRFYQCDKNGRAKVSNIMTTIADVAGLDYTNRGYGRKDLWEQGMVFLLSRLTIKFNRMPSADSRIVYRTWEHGIEGAQFFRYFNVLDRSGAELLSCNSAWLLADPVSRKIHRPSVFKGRIDPSPEEVLAPRPYKIKIDRFAQKAGEKKVRFTDIDGNGHMNNGHYADIAYDFISPDLSDRETDVFSINFNHEAKLGDLMEIFVSQDSDSAMVYAMVENTLCFSVEITFKK